MSLDRRWRKSSYSPNKGNEDCVEVARFGDNVVVRDTKLRDRSPILTVTTDGWRALITAIRVGELGS
uniref:DUF397 domain-containing protein n=1 Tax=Pseudonocardia sp. CA-138482 TaxID=3240023 RepID=UPI003F4985C0